MLGLSHTESQARFLHGLVQGEGYFFGIGGVELEHGGSIAQLRMQLTRSEPPSANNHLEGSMISLNIEGI